MRCGTGEIEIRKNQPLRSDALCLDHLDWQRPCEIARDRATATTHGLAMLSHIQTSNDCSATPDTRASFTAKLKIWLPQATASTSQRFGSYFCVGSPNKNTQHVSLRRSKRANEIIIGEGHNGKHTACAGIYRTTDGKLDGYSIMFPSWDVTARALIERISQRVVP
jgi:hypothetical protein